MLRVGGSESTACYLIAGTAAAGHTAGHDAGAVAGSCDLPDPIGHSPSAGICACTNCAAGLGYAQ
eukprot:2585817-Amphidinium_carterae.1